MGLRLSKYFGTSSNISLLLPILIKHSFAKETGTVFAAGIVSTTIFFPLTEAELRSL